MALEHHSRPRRPCGPAPVSSTSCSSPARPRNPAKTRGANSSKSRRLGLLPLLVQLLQMIVEGTDRCLIGARGRPSSRFGEKWVTMCGLQTLLPSCVWQVKKRRRSGVFSLDCCVYFFTFTYFCRAWYDMSITATFTHICVVFIV